MTPLANQPAFPNLDIPVQGHPGCFSTLTTGGLTKREYFSGLAMQGLIAAYQSQESMIGLSRDAKDHGETKVEQTMARWAVEQADTLIRRLEETP